MREESHLDEMRNAIRGDFERLAARRGEQELMRVGEPEPEEDSPDGPPEEPQEPVQAGEPGVQDEPPVDQAEEREEESEEDPEPDLPRRSWLARMFST